jgi:alpha/beta superfamily hydrolase
VSTISGEMVTVPGGEVTLEGMLHLPEGSGPFPGAVVCHPHPQFGGDMYNNVVGALVKACLGSGVAALRFNFRGVGESTGAYGGGEAEKSDVIAALDYLRARREIDGSKVALTGYSFGAMVALRVADGREDLAAVVAVSTPTQHATLDGLHLAAPALFVTGDRDEYCDHELLQEHREQLGGDVTVVVVPGVDHFWWGSDGRLIEAVSGFLREQLG